MSTSTILSEWVGRWQVVSGASAGPLQMGAETRIGLAFPGQAFCGIPHTVAALQWARTLPETGLKPVYAAIGGSSGSLAALIAGIPDRLTVDQIVGGWQRFGAETQPEALLHRWMRGRRPLLPHRGLLAGLATELIDFGAVLKSPTFVGVVAAESHLLEQAPKAMLAGVGLAGDFLHALRDHDAPEVAEAAARHGRELFDAGRHSFEPVTFVSRWPEGRDVPPSFSPVANPDEMVEATMGSVSIPGLFGAGTIVTVRSGGNGSKRTRVLDGAWALAAPVEEALTTGADVVFIFTDSRRGYVHMNEINHQLLAPLLQLFRRGERLTAPLNRLPGLQAVPLGFHGVAQAVHTRRSPRDMKRLMEHFPNQHVVVIPRHPGFPPGVSRFFEGNEDTIALLAHLGADYTTALTDCFLPQHLK